ncbi:hypothetical protein AVEN_128502-1 [Araneus ventricosus]|uniref:Tc1-like transposase DDE domain-containing protein n=1 Tax=Araneus ventricosus TaxID=182803 RepID=A0A4Y2R171_ARAVE|nr:hypothetical protein AVEN_128502-1 [Araneus ventricosus]
MDQWATVLFTDESRFSLNTDSRCTFIWRESGTRYLPSNVGEIDHYGGGGLMVCAGIMLDGRTRLHVFERGTVTSVRYRDEILEPYVRLFRGAVGPELILMDDNARPHRALLVDEFLESEDIRRMYWLARSPDLNSIEHVWDALGRAIGTRNPPPRTIQEMKTALMNEWDQLPQEMISCLISRIKVKTKHHMAEHYTAEHYTTERVSAEHARVDRASARIQLRSQVQFTVMKRSLDQSQNFRGYFHNVNDQPHPVIRPPVSPSHPERMSE